MASETGLNLLILVFGTVASFLGSKKAAYEKDSKLSEEFKKVINNQQHVHEEAMQAVQINADIIGNSRIEWVQEVRKEATQVINNLNYLSNTSDLELITNDDYLAGVIDNINEIDASLYRMLLYFGDDSKGKKNKDKFKDRKNNEGFNHIIIAKIDDLLKFTKERRKLLSTIQKQNKKLQVQIIDLNISEEFGIFESSDIDFIEMSRKLRDLKLNDTLYNNQNYINFIKTKLLVKKSDLKIYEENINPDSSEKILKKLNLPTDELNVKQPKNSGSKEVDSTRKNILASIESLLNVGELTDQNTQEFTNLMRDYLKVEWTSITNDRVFQPEPLKIKK